MLYKFEPLRRLWVLLENRDRKNAFIIFFLMLIGTLLELLGIGLVIPIFAVIGNEETIHKYSILSTIFDLLGRPSHKALVIYVMIFLLVVYLIKSLFLAFSAYKQSNFIYQLSSKISSKLFRLFLVQPYAFHLNRNSAELIRIVSTDVSMLASVVQSLTIIIAELFVLLGLFVLLVFVEPLGATVSIIVLSLSAWVFYSITKSRISYWGKENQKHGSKKFQHIQQGLNAAKDVKLLGREKEFTDKYNYHNDKIAVLSERQYTVSQLPRLFIELLSIFGLILLVISMIVLGRDITVILPTLALFAAAAFRLMPSINRTLAGVQTIQYSLPSVNCLYEEFQELEALRIDDKGSPSELQDNISFNQVSFKYSLNGKVILQDITLKIKKGETIGVIGGSGAGKSTMIDILLGLLKPSSGIVSVDGIDIQSNLRGWQDQIGYVPQSIYLTDDTLRRNIAFGIPDNKIDDENIIRAIKAAQLETFINKLENGLETEVGERGVRLSGGQRQRIGIARALYHDPQILVLDEATSSLDYRTEQDVMEAINALHREKTILIVAHRLSTIEKCDRVLRFENGQFVEERNLFNKHR